MLEFHINWGYDSKIEGDTNEIGGLLFGALGQQDFVLWSILESSHPSH